MGVLFFYFLIPEQRHGRVVRVDGHVHAGGRLFTDTAVKRRCPRADGVYAHTHGHTAAGTTSRRKWARFA